MVYVPRSYPSHGEPCRTGSCTLAQEIARLKVENEALAEDNKQLRAATAMYSEAVRQLTRTGKP